jgi:hypothetical protein
MAAPTQVLTNLALYRLFRIWYTRITEREKTMDKEGTEAFDLLYLAGSYPIMAINPTKTINHVQELLILAADGSIIGHLIISDDGDNTVSVQAHPGYPENGFSFFTSTGMVKIKFQKER